MRVDDGGTADAALDNNDLGLRGEERFCGGYRVVAAAG